MQKCDCQQNDSETMSLREYYAGLAMQALIPMKIGDIHQTAELAFLQADAMIAASTFNAN